MKKLFNKLFKQQPERLEYQHIPWEVRASWYDQMHNQRKQEAVIVTKVQLFNKHGEELFDNGFDVEKFDEEYTENSGSGFMSSPLLSYSDNSHFYQKPFTHELEIFPASRETLSYYLDEPIHSIKVTTNKRIYKFKKHQSFFPHFDNQI